MIDAFPNRCDWYTVEQILKVVPMAERTLRARLTSVPANSRRSMVCGPGRPKIVYHYQSLPELAAAHVTAQDQGAAEAPAAPQAAAAPGPRATTADDMAIANLRMLAVREYQSRRRDMSAADAAERTCEEWRKHPRSQTVQFEERLPGGHVRKSSRTVTVGDYSVSTLRAWTAALEASGDNMLSLAPRWKGTRGRNGVRIHDELLRFVYGLSISTVRMDVKAAVAVARQHWSAERGPFPELSLRTWERKLRAMDPRNAGRDLNHSVARFRTEQTPDIETDWNAIGYNDEFQLDDVQSDYYILSDEVGRALRPYCYAVIRCATRQWVALLTSVTPVTQEQVRSLVAKALVSRQGGIPTRMRFERGAVAGDPHLDMVLGQLGVKVCRTSMDGGSSWSGAVPDVAKGHPQGKPLVEANARRWHQIHATMPAQVGPEERHTAPARTANLLKLAQARHARGEFTQLPTTPQWHAIERDMMERFNGLPHTGLPRIVDPVTGEIRHMSPNEAAQARRTEEVRVMDPEYLMLFYMRGQRLPVTQNGVRVNDVWYGRFDDELKALQAVTVHVDPGAPDIAYVADLGRCIDRYDKAQFGETADQQAGKGHFEKRFRNQHEQVMQAVVANLQNGVSLVDAVYVPSDPVPERPMRSVRIERLDHDVARMRGAVRNWRQAQEEFDKRFEFGAAAAPAGEARSGGRGLLSQAAEIGEQVEMLAGSMKGE